MIRAYIYPTPLHEQDAIRGQFFKRGLKGLNLEFSFFLTGFHTRVKELSLPYYLLIAWGNIVGFIPFERVSAMEKANSPIQVWTQVTVSISNDDNHYTMSIGNQSRDRIRSVLVGEF